MRSPLCRMFFNNGACTVLTCDCRWRAADNLLHSFFAQLLMQRTQRGAFSPPTARGGIAVETMRSSGIGAFRTQRRRSPSMTPKLTRSAVYGGAEKLIQHQNMVVFIQNDVHNAATLLQMRRRLFFALQQREPAESRTIASTGFAFRVLNCVFVHPHLAFTQDAINQHFCCPFRLGAQKLSMGPTPLRPAAVTHFTDGVSVFMGAILNNL